MAIKVADAIGVLAMLLLLVVSWPLGAWVLRSQGRAAWRRLSVAVSEGRSPGREVLDGALILIGGLLADRPGVPVGRARPARAVAADPRAPARPPGPPPAEPLRGQRHAVRSPRRDRTTSIRPRPTSTSPSCRHDRSSHARLRRWLGLGRELVLRPGRCVADRCSAAGSEVMVLPGVRLPASDSHGSAGEEWRLEGDGVALVATPVGELVDVQAAPGRDRGLGPAVPRQRPVRPEHEVDCLGLRSAWSDAIDLARSSRSVPCRCGSSPDEGFALTAFRPRKAKAHDARRAGRRGARRRWRRRRSRTRGCPPPTTPTAGRPAPASSCGWPVATGAIQSSSTRDAPRERLSGARAQAPAGELDVRAEPFRWHSRGARGRRDVHPGPPAMSADPPAEPGPLPDRGDHHATSAACSPRALVDSFVGVLGASGVSLEELGKAMAALAEREGSNPLFELETGRLSEARFMGSLADELSARRGSRVDLDGFGERYFRHLEPERADDRLHARAARARLPAGHLHQQRARVGGAVAGDAPGRRDLRRGGRLGVRGQPASPSRGSTRSRSSGSAPRPDATLFIDDVELNCQGARELGMQAIRFRSTDQAIEAIEAVLGS